jgi:hypothetical protein
VSLIRILGKGKYKRNAIGKSNRYDNQQAYWKRVMTIPVGEDF